MEFFARGGGLAEGHRPIEKIFHCVSISNGERGEEGVRTEGGGGVRGVGGLGGKEALTDRCQRN